MANRSVQPFLHSSRQKAPILYNGRLYPPELPLQMWGIWTPMYYNGLGPMRAHNRNGTLIGSAVFAQMTAECSYTLQWFPCSPSKLPFPMLASGPTWFIGPTRMLNPNGNLIVSLVFAGLTSVTDLQSDRQTDIPRYIFGAVRHNNT